MSRQGNKFACSITGLESYYTVYVTQGTVLDKKKKLLDRSQQILLYHDWPMVANNENTGS